MQILADEQEVGRLIDELARQIERTMRQADADQTWALVGIRSRGDLIARRVAQRLASEHIGDRVGVLDITLYRDDLSEIGAQAVVRTTEIPFDVEGLNVVLIDDVLMTGRSVRAALQSLMDLGRPSRVWLAVLVDRGGRELPIAPDCAALDVSQDEVLRPRLDRRHVIEVHLAPMDETDQIVLCRKHAAPAAAAPPAPSGG